MSLVFKTLIYRVKQFKPPTITNTTTPMLSEEEHPPIHRTDELITTGQSIVQRLDDAIESTKSKIEKMEESEQFLGTRIRRYRQMLAEHQMRIDKNYDVISISDRKRHVEQQEKYQQQICDVIDIHKNILTQLETLRRKLKDLEKKRKDFMAKKDECEQYIALTSGVDVADNSSQECDENNFDDLEAIEMEMGVLNRVDPSHLQIS
jgi:prefoldin subunit 5